MSYSQTTAATTATSATQSTIKAQLKTRFNTTYMVQLALLIAIIIVMSMTPLGYIKTPALSITLLTVPVAIGAILLGPIGGAVCGLTFGLTSFAQCFGTNAFGTALLMINPVGSFMNTVVARVLVGFFTGLIFKYLHKIKATRRFSYYIASLACPLLNTVLFMSMLVIFFYNTDLIQTYVSALGASNPFIFVILFVGAQGALEAVICFLVASVISRTLYAIVKRDK